MKLSDKIHVYCKSMGKVFRVQHIAKSDEEANSFCKSHQDTGVIAKDNNGLIYIAELYNMTIKANILPD